MRIADLTKVWVCRPITTKVCGENETKWKYIEKCFLNLQQDVNSLDMKASGEVDYDIIKARIDKSYSFENGYGINFTNISKDENIKPEYRILDQTKIGKTAIYRLEKYYGD